MSFMNSVANNMVQAFSIISKCLNCGMYDSNSEFEVDWEPKFLILASHGIGNCYLWEPISDNGFHTKVTGYTAVADFIYYECNSITLEEKMYPLIFLLRNSIELCLKRLFYSSVDNGVPRQMFFSKRRSHLLKKDLWKNVRPIILHYQNKSVIEIIESNGCYYPNFKYKNKECNKAYQFVLNCFNQINESDYAGLVFGFAEKGIDQYFGSVNELYQYFMDNPLITDAFDLWHEEYVILQLQYTDLFNMIPVDFNDFIQIMPPIWDPRAYSVICSRLKKRSIFRRIHITKFHTSPYALYKKGKHSTYA